METQNNNDAIFTPEEEIKFRELTNKILTRQSSIFTPEEEIKFRELTNKILTQQSSIVEILSISEKEELLQLIEKLKIVSQKNKLEEVPQENKLEERDRLKSILYLLSVIAIFAALVGMPTLIVFYITGSQLLAILTVISTTLLSILFMLSYFGRFSWSWLWMIAGAFIVAIILLALLGL